MAGDDVRKRAFELRAKGCTYALIEKRLGIPYLRARELGTEYDARHGKPGRIVRTLADETSGLGSTVIPVRDLRNDTARILRQVEKGQTFVVTVSGHKVAELRPVSDSAFVPRSVVESILREAPLDRHFARDIEAAAGQRVDDI